MGLFKKVFRPVRKIAKKIIPKEIRPALPYLAAFYGGPAMAGSNTFLSGIGNATLRNAISKGLIAGATAAATDDDANILRTAALAGAPDLISGGLGNVAGRIDPNLIADSDSFVQIGDMAAKTAGTLSRASEGIKAAGALKTIGAQTTIDSAAKFAEIRQDEIDAYNANLLEQGVQDKTKRRAAIFGIYKNAGYDDDYVNNMLDRYGYDMGGIVEFFKSLNLKVPKGMKAMSNRKKLYDDKDENIVIPPEKPKEDDEDSEPVPVREVDKYDLAGGLMAAADGVQKAFGRGFGEMEPVPMLRFARGGEVEEEGIMSKIVDSMGDDYDYFTRIKIRENLKQGETNEDAINLAEQEAMGMVKEKYGFARGGEVEIEEETDDLGIMDLMRDQGIEYGEQASNAQNDEILERLFEEFLDMGFSPEDAAKKAREAFDDMSQGQGIKGTQVASGYKDDIEEMYEQYVFEMEEQGLEPMDFASFLRQARSGMAGGGKVGALMELGKAGIKSSMQGLSKLKNMVVTKLSRMTDDVELRGSTDYAEDTGASFELQVTAKTKKGKKTLDSLVEEGVVEKLDDNTYFISDANRDAISGMKGLKASGMLDEGAETFTRFDQGAGRGVMDMPYAGYDEVIDTFSKKAEGGIMNRNLLNTGMDKDMRGGGFIPEGTKEKADDVPARLSKNEFVMTADAVRAAGGGSVNEGAKRMYETMHKLEAKV